MAPRKRSQKASNAASGSQPPAKRGRKSASSQAQSAAPAADAQPSDEGSSTTTRQSRAGTRNSRQRKQAYSSPPETEDADNITIVEAEATGESQPSSSQGSGADQPLPSRTKRNVSATSSDPALILANALERIIKAMRDNVMTENNSQFMNRMTTAKELPVFSGNFGEWLNFKEVYDLTTKLGGYSDRDNMTRLFRALQGEARDTVSTLLATSRDPVAIMRTLELHYGNKNTIAQKIDKDLRELPTFRRKR